jgi:hypothetical protein
MAGRLSVEQGLGGKRNSSVAARGLPSGGGLDDGARRFGASGRFWGGCALSA